MVGPKPQSKQPSMAHLRLEIDAESISDEERKGWPRTRCVVRSDCPKRTRPIIGERAQVRAWSLLRELEGELR